MSARWRRLALRARGTAARSPISGIAKCAKGGAGVRAGWQEWQKTLACLHRIAATAAGSRWQEEFALFALFALPPRLRPSHARLLQAERAVQPLAIDPDAFHDPLHVVAGLAQRDHLDPVDHVDL